MKKLLLAALMICVPVMAFAQQYPPPSQNPCAVGQQNVGRVLEGSIIPNLRCTRDGAIVEVPWANALGLEGRVFGATFGPGVTSVAGKTALTAGSPDANIDVPVGVTIIPVYASLNLTAAAGTVNSAWIQVNANLTGNGTSTAGPVPINTRITDQPFTSRVVTRQAYTVAGTAPTTSFELAKISNAAAASAATPWEWTWSFINNARLAMPIVGPASVSFYSVATTTASTFQLRVFWIELPSSTVQ